ncbi:amidoligase family protein [Laceyella tengchongensis]|uniref:amidoligase family protein n=1 Tax=Laceyella tengchongensis TaxID=574699 RepID=UPI00167002CC
MWPKIVDWKELAFGVEIEFVGGDPAQLACLPGWVMSLEEKQLDETGRASGSELKTPSIRWDDRQQIQTMLSRLKEQGASANWSCGLHVHVGLELWGESILLPMMDAALSCQEAMRSLLRTSAHRLIFCPPVTQEIRERFIANRCEEALLRPGRPQSQRCGINLASWFYFGTVEIRYANGTLCFKEIVNTIELCLRFVAAVGAGHKLTCDPDGLAQPLGAPAEGYPPPLPVPRWYEERVWLEELLIPILLPLIAEKVPGGEIHHLLPVPDGLLIAVEMPDSKMCKYVVCPPATGWDRLRRMNG